MLKNGVLVLLLLISFLATKAQQDTSLHIIHKERHLRMSLITCGPGNDIWEVFGHTCIRVVDSARNDSFRDAVFNYGMFDYNHANFFGNVVKGTLPYYLGVVPFSVFRQLFEERKRSMHEEVLLLDMDEKERLLGYLDNNALPQNREYKYDFLVDNCSTRLRDLFPRVFGNKFIFGNAMPAGGNVTYRDISDQYAYRKPLERFGVYIFLGSTMDKVIDSQELLFIPDYLSKAMAGATLDGKKVAGPAVQLLPGYDLQQGGINEAFAYCSLAAIITIAGLSVKKWRKAGTVISTALLIITGVVGCIILFFWLGTDHLCAHYNYNILWAMPLNVAAPFLAARWKSRYSVLALFLIALAVLVHLLRIQVMPLLELSPLFLALAYIHGSNYREAKAVMMPGAAL